MKEIKLFGTRGDNIVYNVEIPTDIAVPNSPQIDIRRTEDGALMASSRQNIMTAIINGGYVEWTIPTEISAMLDGRFKYDVSILDDDLENTIQYGDLVIKKDVTRRDGAEIPVLSPQEYIETLKVENLFIYDATEDIDYRVLDVRDLEVLQQERLIDHSDTPSDYGTAGQVLTSNGVDAYVNMDIPGFDESVDRTITGAYTFTTSPIIPTSPTDALGAVNMTYVENKFNNAQQTYTFTSQTAVDQYISNGNLIQAGSWIIIQSNPNSGRWSAAIQLNSSNYTDFPSAIAGGDVVETRNGLEDAVADGNDYIRKNNAWVQANYFDKDASQTINNSWTFTGRVTANESVANRFGGGVNWIRVQSGSLYPEGTVRLGSSTNPFTGGTVVGRLDVATLNSTATDYTKVAVGTNSQQPTGEAGMIRFNSELQRYEGFDGVVWGNLGSNYPEEATTKTVTVNSDINLALDADVITLNINTNANVTFNNGVNDGYYTLKCVNGDFNLFFTNLQAKFTPILTLSATDLVVVHKVGDNYYLDVHSQA